MKPKNIFDEVFHLRAENSRLTAENAELRGKPCPHVSTSREGTSFCQLAQSSILELDAARKVATAAVAYLAAVDSFGETRSAKEYFDRYNPANEDLRAAIASYRALTEPLSPKTQADLDHALQALREKEESGELEKIAYQQGGNASL
jgi:hypothetical protein